jgi:Putative DNA-binding domain
MDASFQRSFARALFDPNLAAPQGIARNDENDVTRRFAVHRNNMVVGLVNAISARFPAVEKLVGQDFFATMARAFVQAQPPRTPLLTTYGDEFPDFIRAFVSARELPYLADVARIEAARMRAYHAADAAPLGADALTGKGADVLIALRVKLHPSLEIVRSEHPIVTIWAMNSGEQKLAPIGSWNGEDALVIRPHLDVEVRRQPPGGAAFLLALADGATLGAAADAAFAESEQFDLTVNLAQLLGIGVVCGVASDSRSVDGSFATNDA